MNKWKKKKDSHLKYKHYIHAQCWNSKYIIIPNPYYSDNHDIRGMETIPFNAPNKVHTHTHKKKNINDNGHQAQYKKFMVLNVSSFMPLWT
jgi:hypothetical protein